MSPSLSAWERLEYALTAVGSPRDLAKFRDFVSTAFFGRVDSLRRRLKRFANSDSTVSRALYSLLEFVVGLVIFVVYYAFVLLLAASPDDPYPDIYPDKKE